MLYGRKTNGLRIAFGTGLAHDARTTKAGSTHDVGVTTNVRIAHDAGIADVGSAPYDARITINDARSAHVRIAYADVGIAHANVGLAPANVGLEHANVGLAHINVGSTHVRTAYGTTNDVKLAHV